jgi:hypothetical protein
VSRLTQLGAAPVCLDLRGRAARALFVLVPGDADVEAALGEQHGRRLADPGVRSCDDRH